MRWCRRRPGKNPMAVAPVAVHRDGSIVPWQSSIDESRPGAPPHDGAKGHGVAGRAQSTFDRIR